MYRREGEAGAVTAGQGATTVLEKRGACDDAWDHWMHCIIKGECFISRGPDADHNDLKECVKIETACEQLREAVKVCRRAQVDNRKRFKGPQGDRR